jgi:TetR/AcrR family transcriptional regulator
MPVKPGERKLQILQVLAQMLEAPKGEKITTAAIAAKLEVSEAALYRHFASKAQMFEGLIEFIEETLFSLINQVITDEPSAVKQIEAILGLLLGFAQTNRGMTKVLIGDALVHENDRLQIRINVLHDRLEATLKQCLRNAISQREVPAMLDTASKANMLICFVIGRWHQFAKSGFKRQPKEFWALQWPGLLGV